MWSISIKCAISNQRANRHHDGHCWGEYPNSVRPELGPRKKESTVMKKVLVAGAIALASYLLAMGALRTERVKMHC